MDDWGWLETIRLLAALAMMIGAYNAYMRKPTPLRYNGRRYYPEQGGGFTTFIGTPVKDPAILSELTKLTRAPSKIKASS